MSDADNRKEDAEIIRRLINAPARYSFYIDVGSVPPGKVDAFLKEAKQRLKNRKGGNPLNGEGDTFETTELP